MVLKQDIDFSFHPNSIAPKMLGPGWTDWSHMDDVHALGGSVNSTAAPMAMAGPKGLKPALWLL